MAIIIKQKNPKWVEQLKGRLKIPKKEVAIGYPMGKAGVTRPHYKNGASIVEVAVWNNYGTPTQPRRPFMDLSAPKIQKFYKELVSSAVPRLNAGEISYLTILKTAALKSEAIVRDTILTGNYVPNSPETIREKKSNKPLIWDGDMLKYVTSIIRDKSR